MLEILSPSRSLGEMWPAS